MGFTLRKATANKLIARSADVLENFYKAICQVVLQQDYVSADETYHKVLLAKTKPADKGSKKGYFWAVSAPKRGTWSSSYMRMDHALSRSYLTYSLIIKVPYRVMHMLLTGNWSRMLILTL